MLGLLLDENVVPTGELPVVVLKDSVDDGVYTGEVPVGPADEVELLPG